MTLGVFTNKPKMPILIGHDIELTFINKSILIEDIYTTLSININYKVIHKISFVNTANTSISLTLNLYHFQ